MIRTETTAHEVGLQVGDYFTASWGYDQTNIDFWQVVELTPSGKSVKVRKCYTVGTGLHPEWTYQEQVMPGAQIEEAPIETKRLRFWYDEPHSWQDREGRWTVSFKFTSYAIAVWAGASIFPTARQTAPGYGH